MKKIVKNIAVITMSVATVSAYTPSVPNSIQKNTIDISSVLAETEAALKIANSQQEWDEISSMMSEQETLLKPVANSKKLHRKPVHPASQSMDITSVLAKAEAALQAAGIKEELDIVTDLLAESIEETKINTKQFSTTSGPSLASLVWDTSSTLAINTGKAIFAFTKEQARPDSKLSKFSQAVAHDLKKKVASIDLSKLEQESSEQLRMLSDVINNYKSHTDILNFIQETTDGKIFSIDDNNDSWKQNVKDFVQNALQSPFAKVWENRASQSDVDATVQPISSDTPTSPSVPPTEVKPFFFMTEKKQKEIATPSISKMDLATPAFVAGSKPRKLSSTVLLAKKFVQAWMRYTSTLITSTFVMKSMVSKSAEADHHLEILETTYSLRLAMIAFQASGSAQRATPIPLEAGSIPYFARVQSKH
jgi:hypothetical protein